jgi:hypothetical protein
VKRSPIKLAVYALLGSFSITMFFWHPAAVGSLVTDAARTVTPIWTALTSDGTDVKPPKKDEPAKGNGGTADQNAGSGVSPIASGLQPADSAVRSGVDVLFGKGLLGIVAFLTTLLPTIKGLRAFGVNPLDMIKPSWSGGGGDGKDSGKLTLSSDFRTQFAREFREVTEAIGPERKMVIFIDDLDRCDATSVVQVLQAMNYLVTAGPCVLVAAIDPEYVRACIRLKFKDLIGELAAGRPGMPGSATAGDAAAATARPEDFAAHFLQKLVQVHEPIPRLDAAQTLAMFERAVREDATSQPEPRRPNRAVRVLRHRAMAPAALVLLAIVGAVGGMRFNPISDAESAGQSQAEALAATGSSSGGGYADQANFGVYGSKSSGTGVRALAGQTAPRWPAWYVLPALAAMGLIVLTVVPTLGTALPSPVRDSPEFTQALQRYAPMLYAAGRTPREIKRLLNAMRLMAMRQELLLDETQQVRQPELVGLSVLYDLDPRWLTADGVDEPALRTWCRKLPKAQKSSVAAVDTAKPVSQVEAKTDEDTLIVCATLYARLLGAAGGIRDIRI